MDEASQSLLSHENVGKLLDIHENLQDSYHDLLIENYSMIKDKVL